MQIPTFFLRTTIRLLFFQAFVAWLSIRSHYLPLPSAIGWALTTTLGSYVNDAKDVLDSRFGFVLPWEASFIFPAVLDQYIITSMPDLAILLGTSPCDERVAQKDPETDICIPELANHCFDYADMYAHKPTSGLQVMEACWQNYQVDARTARKHHDRCHGKESPSLMQLIGCMKAIEYWETKREVCGMMLPILHCVAEYGAQDAIAPLWQKSREKVAKEEAERTTTVGEGEEKLAGQTSKAANV